MYKIWDVTLGRYVNEDDVNDYSEYDAIDSPDYHTAYRDLAEMIAVDLHRVTGNDFKIRRT